jgi:hypothetical protein
MRDESSAVGARLSNLDEFLAEIDYDDVHSTHPSVVMVIAFFSVVTRRRVL